MDKICGIYKIRSPSNKVYIGQSVDIKRRFNGYLKCKKNKQVKLFNSFNKYGVNNHIFEIIEECLFENLNDRERFWQEKYDCIEHGLNCVYTETNIKPKKFSKESFDRRSLATKGKPKNYTVWNKGKTGVYSDETLIQMSLVKKGKPCKSKGILRPKNSGENHIYYKRKRPDFSESQIGEKNHMYGKAAPNAKVVIDTVTGREFISMRAAAEFYNVNESTLRQKINGRRNNNTNLKFKNLKDYEQSKCIY